MAETTLQEKLRANKARSISQADATATREKQQKIQQQQKLQKQKEEDSVAYQKYQKDLAEYEKQKKEYDTAVKQLEAEKKAESDKAAAIKAAEQKRIDDQKAINDKYDARITALGVKPSKYYYKPKYYTNRYTGKTRLIGHTRESNNKAIKNYNSKVDAINRERKTANQQFNLANSSLPQWVKTKASRAFARTPNHHGTMLSVAQNYYDNYLITSERKRQSSITTAKSNAVKAREKHEKTIREYEAKKESAPMPIPSVIEKPLTKATKTRPKVHPSSYFKSVEKTPVSIFGTTPLQSNKAEETYDTTQAQQKELFASITKATDYKQAISLREKAMEKNPYVGTANTIFEKGKAVGSSGVLIEKKIHQEDVFEELAKPPELKQEIETTVVPSQNIPKPEIETSYYVAGSLDYIFNSENDIKKQRLQEEIRIAGGTYGDYLKTIENTPQYQLKMVGKGAARAFNSYTSLVGVHVSNSKVAGHSLLDYTTTDIYNSLYAPVISPAKLYLEKLGIKPVPSPVNPKPFALIEKAWNERTPAENAGDLITTGAVETGIFLATGGVGNLAIRGASKLPYLLKTQVPTAKQVIKSAKQESQLTTITLEDGSKVKLPNPDYVEPVSKPVRKKINPSLNIPVKKIKLGGKKIKVTDHDSVTKSPKKPKRKPIAVFVNSKLGRLIGTNFPNTEKLSKIKKIKGTIPKNYDPIRSMESAFINNKAVRKIATKRLPRKDKGKPPKNESGWEWNRVQNVDAPAISKPSTISSKSTTQQVVKIKPPKVKSISKSKPSKKKQNDVSIVEQVLHPNRPKITSVPIQTPMLNNLLGQSTGQQDKIKHDVTPKLDQTTNTLLDNLLKQNQKFDELLGTKSKSKQKSILYDLLVQSGKQGTKQKQDYSFVFVHPPKLTTKRTQKTTQRTRTKTRKLPASIKTPQIGLKQRNHTPKRKRKHTAKYSIWNVDVDNIGTLPGAELVTSKSTKIFKDLDKRQKAHSKKNFKNITTRKTTKKITKKSTPKKKPRKTKR